jgi:predicted AlkP superfamily pyrophosphatase or phosphodiesterase
MAPNKTVRVVLVVLDAFGPEFVSPDLTPAIVRLAKSGGIAPAGGLADMVASTGPGHATLLTGVPSTIHGVLANRLFDAQSNPTENVTVQVPTIIRRAKNAGHSTAIAVSDPDILNT